MRRAAPVLIGLFLAAAFPAGASAATVGHWALDETSGNTVVDSSGFGNNGTSQNMTLDLDGVTGDPGDRAYGYNGSSSRITVPASNSLVAGTNDVTISFYFHSTAHAGSGNFDWDMVKKGGYKIEIYKQKKKEQARCVFNGTAGKVAFQDGPVLTDGQWHHVVCARTGNTVTLTVDGVSFPPRTGGLGTLNKGKELTIGWGSDGTDFFNGTLDDVEIDIG